ncbi:unnamed protein product, partial [Urochloa humidicola]
GVVLGHGSPRKGGSAAQRSRKKASPPAATVPPRDLLLQRRQILDLQDLQLLPRRLPPLALRRLPARLRRRSIYNSPRSTRGTRHASSLPPKKQSTHHLNGIRSPDS